MKRLYCALACVLVPFSAHAERFERPIPQPQTDVAEFWFFMASLVLLAALVCVHLLVSRR
ncbi:hypothetical protein [Tritonibacter mobilis]|uniref:hypothetical protein n=1 Tax=Tritonibacter mobilis TaxID=379347 RepID=UPI00080689A2|nr:hypothetical protein [Tritonibacter mobilis]NKX75557.1 hypothetical protein [Rhodobacteraceae bacterium R_SAG3]PXW82782.1 hypothetical protein BZA02_102101 [Ruegeria sp. P4]SDX66175.1 hypothetical protein SAMN05444385_110124 [Tritonibacter mobilis]